MTEVAEKAAATAEAKNVVEHAKTDNEKAEVIEDLIEEDEVPSADEQHAVLTALSSEKKQTDDSAGDIETGLATEDNNTSALVLVTSANPTGSKPNATDGVGDDSGSGAVQSAEEKEDDMPFYSIIVILLFLAVLVLFAILIWGTGTIDITGGEDFVGEKPTTPFDPYVPGDCDFSGQTQPHVIAQCSCNGEILILSDDAREKYDALVSDFLVPTIYSEWTQPLESCEHENQALVWLSTTMADNTVDLSQRYLMALLYFSTNGPQWETQTLWLEEDDLCMWYGISCTGEGVMREIELESNGMIGQVSPLAECVR